MLIAAVATLRRILTGGWVLLLLGLIGLAVFTRVTTTFVIRGGSMQPAIPLGSLVVLEPVADEEIRPGDMVTIRADNGVLVTHRVTRSLELADGRFLEVKGDANATPDPNLIPVRAVQGRVGAVIPALGYLASMQGTASGLISLLALLAAGMLGIWLIEELEEELVDDRALRREAERAAAVQRQARPPLPGAADAPGKTDAAERARDGAIA
jgi:signal peptidase